MTPLPRSIEDAVRSSAAPHHVRTTFERLLEGGTDAERLDGELAPAIAAVAAASRSLSRLLVTDHGALGVLETAHESTAPSSTPDPAGATDPDDLVRRKRLTYLRIAARDLLGVDGLEQVGASLSLMSDRVLAGAARLAGADGIAVIGMGKHGARELNYSSDVDVLLVAHDGLDVADATARCRRLLAVAGGAFRIDADLRPEGRDGALVRTLESYETYWAKWANPWEFQALLKARHCAGDEGLGTDFDARAASAVWARRLDADALAELRSMKQRSEASVTRRGLGERELKRGPGGIRDIEFAVQLLQLVHGPADPALRVRPTSAALAELASAGYIDDGDAVVLALAYRFLRTVEHRLQLVEEAQVHTVPEPGDARDVLVRVLGMGNPPALEDGTRSRRTSDRFDVVLSRYQAAVRTVHERLFFRPLLEVFGATSPAGARITEQAAGERLAAFGFRDAERTRQALAELTRGLTRTSRMMQQLLPVLLGWLAESPDPDQGLLGLRNLTGLTHHRDVLVSAFRDSPELARRLCTVLGSSRQLGELARHHPSVTLRVADDPELTPLSKAELVERAIIAIDGTPERAVSGLRRIVGSETLRIAAGDLLGLDAADDVSAALAALGDAALAAALQSVRPALPFAVVAVGRLGGEELSYGSDLDVLVVYDGSGAADAARAEQTTASLFRLMNGRTPADRIWTVDARLRPEGAHGPLGRSFQAYEQYHARWISPWERQALLRARPVAGDAELLERFMALVESTLSSQPFTDDDRREIRRLKARTERERIPAGEDPQFHLKLGKGSLADIEWTVQLLQLETGLRTPRTLGALHGLAERGAIEPEDAEVLEEAYRFLTSTRSRWHLVGNFIAGAGGIVGPSGLDSLPKGGEALSRLARSLEMRPDELRGEYRRVTRRARRVVERSFYGL